MSNSKDRNLFQQLSTLFKSGSVVKRKIRSFDTAMATPDKVKSSGVLLFQKSLSPTYATLTSNAYNLSERLMRMQDFCLSGDTLVVTPEKGPRRIDEIVEAWNNGERDQLVFSYDHETKIIISTPITGAKFVGNKEVIKVIFDDGSEIVCTPEHRFMLCDGSYVEAQDLFEKEMMPFRVVEHKSRNIRCVKIEKLNVVIPVYDIEVAKYHNFAITSDRIHNVIFVHNCEMEQCLSGDTLIAIPGGYKRIDELAKECEQDVNKTFVVYAYDHNKKQITPALAKQARQTATMTAYKVTFDSGKTLIGSEDHRLMLRDGTYCKIKDLQPDMAMMPFYRKDLFDDAKQDCGNGYRWIYAMDKSSTFNGWVTEHKLVAEWVAKRKLNDDEVVHHKNFTKYDNNPENLVIMTEHDHKKYHAEILNGKKWAPENQAWIDSFKKRHSEWMFANNPATRHDITFGKILETCERVGFNVAKLQPALDADLGIIRRRLRDNGFKDFQTFAKAYRPGWKNGGWDNTGDKNPRYDHSLTFDMICRAYEQNISLGELTEKLNTTYTKVLNRIKTAGYKTFNDFKTNYKNHKVVSVEYVGILPLYDLTVDGYKNFATDSVISHNTPEIASTLDIVADETVSVDDKGRALHVYSDNPKIKETIEELFYDTLNVEFNLRSIVRNTVKYGDGFQYIDVHPNYGVVGTFPVPVNEIEREENYDRNDPFATRFRWVSMGNRTLENWEIAHFRLLGNDSFLPYGCSWIEPARRIWRQLMLLEDAMLVYRVSRAPERRVFYVDVGNLPANEVEAYMQEQKQALRMNSVIDKETGRVDLRYSPLSIDEDYVLPVRGTETGTKIETLAGLQNQGNVEDVAYLQKKLFAALKIPAAYLGYGDALGSKASLAQLDVRFSRSIASIQRVIIAELNKIAVIHLFAHGFKGDDLQNFVLRLSNPSTVAQQQKLELWRAKFEIAGSAPEGIASRNFIRREILMLNNEQIETLDEERYDEKLVDAAIENAGAGEQIVADKSGGESDEELFGGGADGGGAAPEAKEEKPEAGGAEKEEKPENAGTLPEDDLQLLTSSDVDEGDDFVNKAMLELDSSLPIKPNGHLQKALYNNQRQRHHGASVTYSPEVDRMSKTGDLLDDPYDKDFFRELATENKNVVKRVKITSVMRKTLNDMAQSKRFREANFGAGTEKRVLAEGIDVQDEIDELNNNIELDIDVDITL